MVSCVLFVWKLINFADLFKKAGFKKFIYLLFDLFFRLPWIFAACGLCLAVVSGDYSLEAVCWLLTAVASLVGMHKLKGTQASVAVARGLRSCSPRALEHRLSDCGTWTSLLHNMWDHPRPGSKPCLLHWQVDSLPLSHQRSPKKQVLIS